MSISNNNKSKKATSQKYLENEKNRILSKQNPTFLEKNYRVKNFLVYFILPIAILYSLFTGGTFLYIHFLASFNHQTAALVAAFILVIAVEAGYFWMAKEALEDIADGDYKVGNHYTVAFIIKVFGMVLFGGCSLAFSIKGSPEVAAFYHKKNHPIILVDKDVINARYDAQLAEANKSQSAASEMTWKGKIVQDGRKLYNKAEDSKLAIEANRKIALENATTENNKREGNYEATTKTRGHWFTAFAGGGQIVSFLILIFILVFEHGVAMEEGEDDTDSSTLSNGNQKTSSAAQKAGSIQIKTPAVAGLKPIQFRYPNKLDKQVENDDPNKLNGDSKQVEKTPPNKLTKQVDRKSTNKLKKKAVALSEHGFQDTNKLTKQLENDDTNKLNQNNKQVEKESTNNLNKQVGNGRVFIRNSHLVFEHIKDDGTTVWYSKTKVTDFVNIYKKRLEESKVKLEKAIQKDNPRLISIHKKAVNNRSIKLEYWTQALELFEDE